MELHQVSVRSYRRMIVRSPRPDSHFTILANETLRNPKLTLRARGLLALLLSYPDNWRTSSTSLALVCPDGRDAIRTALRELDTAGYLRRIKTQDEAGRWTTDTFVYDTPQTSTASSPACPQPTPGNPTPESQAILERPIKKNHVKESSLSSRVRTERICGQCSGSGWKPTGKSLARCDCDGGIRRWQ